MEPLDLDKLGPDLSAYLDGELSPEKAEAVEKLLSESPEARRRLEELRAVSGRVANLPRAHAPESLDGLLRRQMERHMLLDARPRKRTIRLYTLATRGLAAAAVLVGCTFVGWQVLRKPAPTAPAMTEVAASDKDDSAVEYVQLTPEVKERLRSLGYIADDDEAEETPLLALAEAGKKENAGAAPEQQVDELGKLAATRGDRKLSADDELAAVASEELGEGVSLYAKGVVGDALVAKAGESAALSKEPPVVEVVVTAASPDQTADVLAVLDTWREPREKYDNATSAGGFAAARRVPRSELSTHEANRTARELSDAGAEETVEILVAQAEVAPLVAALEAHAPRQVSLGYTGFAAGYPRHYPGAPLRPAEQESEERWERGQVVDRKLSLGTPLQTIPEQQRAASRGRANVEPESRGVSPARVSGRPAVGVAKNEDSSSAEQPTGDVVARRRGASSRMRAGRGFVAQPVPATASPESTATKPTSPSPGGPGEPTSNLDFVGPPAEPGPMVARGGVVRVPADGSMNLADAEAGVGGEVEDSFLAFGAAADSVKPATGADDQYFYSHYGEFEAKGRRLKDWLFTPFADNASAPASQPADARVLVRVRIVPAREPTTRASELAPTTPDPEKQ